MLYHMPPKTPPLPAWAQIVLRVEPFILGWFGMVNYFRQDSHGSWKCAPEPLESESPESLAL